MPPALTVQGYISQAVTPEMVARDTLAGHPGSATLRKRSSAMHQERLRFTVKETHEVSALLFLPERSRALYLLAPGAGAGMEHSFMNEVAEGLAERRIATLRYQFPYAEQGRRRPDPAPILQATVRAAAQIAVAGWPALPLFAGGKSMGGRMTSLAAATEKLPGVRGLIFLGFPLHPAGKPGDSRAEHLPRVGLPMLFIQGTRDSLADLALIQRVCWHLGPACTLHEVREADHGFGVRKRSGRTVPEVRAEVLDTLSDWVDRLLLV